MFSRIYLMTLIIAIAMLTTSIAEATNEYHDEIEFTLTRRVATNDPNLWNRSLGDTVRPNGILSTDKNAAYGDAASAEIIRVSCSDSDYMVFHIHREDNIETTIRKFIPFRARVIKQWGNQKRQVTLKSGERIRYWRHTRYQDELYLDKRVRDRETGRTLADICRVEHNQPIDVKILLTIYSEGIDIDKIDTRVEVERTGKSVSEKSDLIEGTTIAPSKGAPTNPYKRHTLTTMWARLKK